MDIDFKRVDYVTRSGKESHKYLLNGVKVDGVTSILDGFIPKPQLVNWVAKQAGLWAEKNLDILNESPTDIARNIVNNAQNKKDRSAKSGTDKHEVLEKILKNEKVAVIEEYAPDIKKLLTWIKVFKPEVIYSEGVHLHTGLKYAGTSDIICKIKGETWLIDLKTGKGIYNQVALQLTAYAEATHVLTDDGLVDMPKIDRLGVLHLYTPEPEEVEGKLISHDTTLRFLELKPDVRYWDLFQNGLYFHRWNKKNFKDLFKEI